MIDTEEVQHRGVEIMNIDWILDDVVAELVGRPDCHPLLHTRASHPHGEGARVVIAHAAENLEGADAVVVSTAVRGDNPEVIAARARRIPVVPRALMLAELKGLLALPR